jgi:hypothetical protein
MIAQHYSMFHLCVQMYGMVHVHLHSCMFKSQLHTKVVARVIPNILPFKTEQTLHQKYQGSCVYDVKTV